MNFVFLALALNGTVKAHFDGDMACKNFCSQNGLTYLPFNLRNGEGAAPTPVGQKYIA
jgi:hypothetical protein